MFGTPFGNLRKYSGNIRKALKEFRDSSEVFKVIISYNLLFKHLEKTLTSTRVRGKQKDSKRRPFPTRDTNFGYCNHQHLPGKRNCSVAEARYN